MSYPASILSTEVRIIADLLIATSVDEVVTYDAMSEALGSPIKNKRYVIPPAMKLASKEVGANFRNVRKVGYHRIPSAEVHQIGFHARRRMRRTSSRAISAIDSTLAKANDMDDAATLRACKEISVLDLLRYIARDRVVRSLPESNRPEPVARTMANVVKFINGDKDDEVA